jgi:hypothetical protein
MSEYQYYEFRAIEKPLTGRQMRELRELSTRAEITPTSFTNEYHWGDFRGSPRQMMEKYFDAFLYYANWGTHWFMLRLPKKLVDPKTIRQYAAGESLNVWTKGDFVVLDFQSEDESGDREDDEESDRLASLIPLRADLLGGDLRSPYLGWLASAQNAELDENEHEPPVPPGLKRLSASLKTLAEFLRINDKLLKVAAAPDTSKRTAASSQTDLNRWIDALPLSEKNKILRQLVARDAPCLREQVLQRFRQSYVRKNRPKVAKAAAPARRTVGELLAAAGLTGATDD